jgi:hypothetical protein
MADRSLTTGIPIWVRVSGIIALVLIGVVVGSLLLGRSAAGPGGGGHGQMGQSGQMGSMAHNPGPQPTGTADRVGLAETPWPSGQHISSGGVRGH